MRWLRVQPAGTKRPEKEEGKISRERARAAGDFGESSRGVAATLRDGGGVGITAGAGCLGEFSAVVCVCIDRNCSRSASTSSFSFSTSAALGAGAGALSLLDTMREPC